jgi:hypothetical protein
VGLYYTSTLYKETIPCIPGTGSSEESIKPFDLAVDVPDSGGIATKSQQLRGMPPSVTVVYVKEDKGE